MQCGHALIPSRREPSHVLVILRADLLQEVAPTLIGGGAGQACRADLANGQLSRTWRPRRDEAFVYIDVDRVGVIDREELELIDVGDFPQLLGELHAVAAIHRFQPLAGNAEILARGLRRPVDRLLPCHDAQRHAEGARPGDVGEELVCLPIPRIEEGAGPF